ncbi:hypothetical protein F1640_04190 [Novosphingobium sp. NBM11]|nr:hypothetical protein [Novosphingobium sp. NBM11]
MRLPDRNDARSGSLSHAKPVNTPLMIPPGARSVPPRRRNRHSTAFFDVSCRFPARVNPAIQTRLESLPRSIREIAWKAMRLTT